MIRKHWEPGGGNKALRGRDEWIRISWDEALDILASEQKRVKETYGNEAMLAPWIGEIAARALGAFGGFTEQWGAHRSEEHTSELQSIMRSTYAVLCLKKKKNNEYTNKEAI